MITLIRTLSQLITLLILGLLTWTYPIFAQVLATSALVSLSLFIWLIWEPLINKCGILYDEEEEEIDVDENNLR